MLNQFRATRRKVKKAGILAKMQYCSLFGKPQVSVIGSYATGNVGDRAIGQGLVQNLCNQGIESDYFSRKVRLPKKSTRILGGGGVIHQYRERKIRRDMSLLDEDSMIIGIGVSPVHDENLKEVIRKNITDLPLVTVRDQRSKKVLESFVDRKIQSLACPAFLLDVPEGLSKGYTGVSLRSLPIKQLPNQQEERERKLQQHLGYENMNISNIKDRYYRNIHKIGNNINNVRHIPFHHFDSEFVDGFENIDGFDYQYNVTRTLSRVANSKRMICMRYHSLVFSILCNKPSIAITYAPKVENLAERAGIPCFAPDEEIEFNFTTPSNRDDILTDARKNIDLIKKYFK